MWSTDKLHKILIGLSLGFFFLINIAVQIIKLKKDCCKVYNIIC